MARILHMRQKTELENRLSDVGINITIETSSGLEKIKEGGINFDDHEFFVELAGMLKTQDERDVVAFLKTCKNQRDVLWKQKSLAESRQTYEREIMIYRTEEEGVQGVGVCPYCHSDKLAFHTKQLRAADEPATIFYRCVKCKRQWRG